MLKALEGSREAFSAETQDGGGAASAFPQLLKIFLKLNCYKMFPRACSPLTLTRPRTLVFAVLLRVVGEREHHDISVMGSVWYLAQNKGSPSGWRLKGGCCPGASRGKWGVALSTGQWRVKCERTRFSPDSCWPRTLLYRVDTQCVVPGARQLV